MKLEITGGRKKLKRGEREKIGVRSLINPHPPKKKNPRGNIKVCQNPAKNKIGNCVS